MQTPVYDFLKQYARQNPVRMHMPGHKRNEKFLKGFPVDIDITEGLSMKKGLNEQQYEVLQAMTGIDN